MDIAKIRKKAREKELKKAQENGEAEETRDSRLPARPDEEAENAVQEPTEQMEEETAEEIEVESEPLPDAPEQAEAPVPEVEELPEPGILPEEDTGSVLELLTFSIAEREFAFSVADLEEIIPCKGITYVPLLPGYVSGIMSLRGKIIPVIDLRSRFGLGRNPNHSTSSVTDAAESKEKILILSGPKGHIGAAVERVKGVVRCQENSVLAPPAHLTEEERRFIEGVVVQEKRFISIIRLGDTMNIEVG